MKKISFIAHGIINIVMHIPVLVATSFWGLLIMGIFNLHTITDPFWETVTLFPLLIPPVSCVIGIVRGAIFAKRDKYAQLCLLLSALGILLYAGMLAICAWLGSIF